MQRLYSIDHGVFIYDGPVACRAVSHFPNVQSPQEPKLLMWSAAVRGVPPFAKQGSTVTLPCTPSSLPPTELRIRAVAI